MQYYWQTLGGQHPLMLGSEVGSGGEAKIYRVANMPQSVVKLYHAEKLPLPQESVAKLSHMIQAPPDIKVNTGGYIGFAWPQYIVYGVGKLPKGFLMPYVDRSHSQPLATVYNPKDRRLYASGFNWKYLMTAAQNLAMRLRDLHARDYVVGDLNESNVLVRSNAFISIIDCDSIQAKNGSTIYRCTVGKEEYTPPELQGYDFSQVNRTKEHDNFGLAILIFLLLMEGIHPYSGVLSGQTARQISIGEKIKNGFCPYTVTGACHINPAPVAPRFNILPPSVQILMRQCFEEGHTNPKRRPQPSQWVTALADATRTLRKCQRNPEHWYSAHISACPWCARITQYNISDPFPATQAAFTQIGKTTCVECGHINIFNDIYCKECRRSLWGYEPCPFCHKQIARQSLFCGECARLLR